MQLSDQELVPRWQDRLFRSGLALKWLIIGCFAYVAAVMFLPWIAGFFTGTRNSISSDAVFFLVGGLIGAGLGRALEGPRAGGATVILTLIVSTGFYIFDGPTTEEDCQTAWDARERAVREEAQLVVQWGKCLVEENNDTLGEECEQLAWNAAESSKPWQIQRPGAVLDRLRGRQLHLRSWIIENC